MLNSSPVRILRSFSKDEMKDFKEFISSPYFNKNQNVKILFNFLKKYYPEFNSSDLEKEKIYRKFFKNGEYNDGFMRSLIFNISKLLEEYLAYLNFRKDEIFKGISLLKELNERKIEKVFMKNFRAVEEMNEASLYKDPDFFMNKYKLTTLRELHSLWNKSEYSRDLNEIFKKSYENMNFFYLSSILREYRYLIYLRDFSSKEYQSDFIEYIIDFLSGKDNLYIQNPYINLHLNEIFLQKEKDPKYFHILKDILKNKPETISRPDRFSLQNILQIFCINKIYEGETQYNDHRKDLFGIILKQKLFSPLENDYFEITLFANIVNFGIAEKDFQWTEKIIRDFKDKLSPLHGETFENYAYAKLNFEKQNFELTLSHLNRISAVKHRLIKLPVRFLTIETLFELDMMEQVFYQIDSLRHYISNNKDDLSADRLKRVNNFLKYFNRLAKLKEKMNKDDLRNLLKDIEKDTNTNERKWLLSAAERMKKGK